MSEPRNHPEWVMPWNAHKARPWTLWRLQAARHIERGDVAYRWFIDRGSFRQGLTGPNIPAAAFLTLRSYMPTELAFVVWRVET